MFPSFLLALREGVEAALIIGIVLGVLNQLKRPALKPVVWRGAAAGALLSLAAAVLLNLLGASFEGRAEELFEGIVMLLAAGVLTWMIFWMRRQSRALQQEVASKVAAGADGKGSLGLFVLAFAAVLREGIELALFLLAAQFNADAASVWAGAALGLAAAALLGWAIHSGVGRLQVRDFFRVTNLLLVLFAAGLVGMGVHEFNEAGIIPAVIDPLYNISAVLAEDSLPDQLLKALLGYNANPSLSETLAYAAFLLSMVFLLPERRGKQPAAAQAWSIHPVEAAPPDFFSGVSAIIISSPSWRTS